MLNPISIVISDEILLQQECCEKIILDAKQQGVEERTIVDVAEKFGWDDLIANNNSLSLFSEKKLTDIRFSKSPNKEAQQALVNIAENADNDNLILIRLPKLEKRQKATKWFKAISSQAKVEELWPPKPGGFHDWILGRSREAGIKIDHEACAMLAERTEGNLLAASQSLEKIQLLFPDENINIERLRSVVSDNAKYSVFLCLEEALAGRGERAVKMLKKFEKESVAPISILVNMTREIRLCTQVSIALLKSQSAMQALSSSYLWESKKKLIAVAAARLPLPIWQKLVIRCAHLDRLVKGQEKGNIWLEIEFCIWLLSGKRIWRGNK